MRLVRSYDTESPLGAFTADVIRELTSADASVMNAGGLCGDLPEGDITVGNVEDAFPFANSVDVFALTGREVREILEQSFTLVRGMDQVSGIEARYDLSRPPGERLVDARVAGETLDDSRIYRVATNSFLGEGGDLHETFVHARKIKSIPEEIAQVMIDYLRKQSGPVPAPAMGRLVPVEGSR